jgi:hypothetical protein
MVLLECQETCEWVASFKVVHGKSLGNRYLQCPGMPVNDVTFGEK